MERMPQGKCAPKFWIYPQGSCLDLDSQIFVILHYYTSTVLGDSNVR